MLGWYSWLRSWFSSSYSFELRPLVTCRGLSSLHVVRKCIILMTRCSFLCSKMLSFISLVLDSRRRLLQHSLLRLLSDLIMSGVKRRSSHFIHKASGRLLSYSRLSSTEDIVSRMVCLASVGESIGRDWSCIGWLRSSLVEIAFDILDSKGVTNEGRMELELRRMAIESVGVEREVRLLVLGRKGETSKTLAHYELYLNYSVISHIPYS